MKTTDIKIIIGPDALSIQERKALTEALKRKDSVLGKMGLLVALEQYNHANREHVLIFERKVK